MSIARFLSIHIFQFLLDCFIFYVYIYIYASTYVCNHLRKK